MVDKLSAATGGQAAARQKRRRTRYVSLYILYTP